MQNLLAGIWLVDQLISTPSWRLNYEGRHTSKTLTEITPVNSRNGNYLPPEAAGPGLAAFSWANQNLPRCMSLSFWMTVPRSSVSVEPGEACVLCKGNRRQQHRSLCLEAEGWWPQARKKESMQAWGQSTAPAKVFLNVLPQNSPLLLGLPAETSGVLLQASKWFNSQGEDTVLGTEETNFCIWILRAMLTSCRVEGTMPSCVGVFFDAT